MQKQLLEQKCLGTALVQNIKFRKTRNPFQKKFQEDIQLIK